jgi:acyl-CoA thioester hydrolase
MSNRTALTDYPSRSYDKLRYGDTDRQGHVNNAVFSTFFETGRVELVFNTLRPEMEAGKTLVIARIELDFVGEVVWPGTVDVGSGITRIGRSSIALEQALFQEGKLVARAVSVVVLTDPATRRSTPLPEAAVERLSPYRIEAAAPG